MSVNDSPTTVMVTGATGYVASWLVRELLNNGHTVHAAVRSPDDPSRTEPLTSLANASNGQLRFFKADLLDSGAFDEAAEGCEVIFHTASPFFTKVDNPQKELVDPALQGTRNVLETANRCATVRRVVLTSSCASIYGDNRDCTDKPYGTLTEDHWNESSSLEHNPYQYSKTVAEQAAWEMVEQQGRWDLVVINPSLVIGPAINPHATSESFDIVRQIGDGTMKMGVPDIGLGAIDVRDLATAHYLAGFIPEASGRHIISATNTSLLDIADALRDRYGRSYPLPKNHVPKFLLWLLGPFQGLSRQFVSRNVGHAFKLDNSKGRSAFGIEYRSLQTSMEDMFAQMIESGIIPDRSRRESAL